VITIFEEKALHSIYLLKTESEIQGVLFDMDGVLINSIPLHIDAWDFVLKKNRLSLIDREVYLQALGRTNLDMLNKFMGIQGKNLSLSAMKEIVVEKEQYFRNLVKDHVEPAPGVVQWLNYFKEKNIRCAAASSGEMANITLMLQALGISDYFASIVSGAHLPASKPNPMIFQLAAASLGVRSEKCLVIEDAVTGIQAAKSANMQCCAIATTLPRTELGNADILLDDLAQVEPESLFSCDIGWNVRKL